ncbi:MAG: pentapeptide repeat-containing protein, partial [Methanosarcinales archaeon]|nr:pentapeptide repeat-containing protein [Methanosarcinales archaeon]
TSDKLYFLCELAWEMIESDELRIHYTEIPGRINEYFEQKIKDRHDLDNWDFDLRSQTLLHRDAAGYYEFAHKSLAEYFVALKFAAELGCLSPDFMQTYCEADGQRCLIPIKQKNISELVETFGALSLRNEGMYAVQDLLYEMIAQDAAKRLWEVVNETKGKTQEQVKYAGGNAATLLKLKGESFSEAKLSHTVLLGADLRGVRLLELQDCNLSEADISGSKFSEDALKSAKLNRTHITLILLADYDKKDVHEIINQIFLDNKRGNPLRGLGLNRVYNEVLYDLKKIIFIISLVIDNCDFWVKVKENFVQNPKINQVVFYDNEREILKKYLSEEELDTIERDLRI